MYIDECTDNKVQIICTKKWNIYLGISVFFFSNFLRVFWLLQPKFNFWKGDWALAYVSTQI